MTDHKNKQFKEEGFALLLTIIVVGVLLSIGLAVLDLTVKQVQLSSNAKDSELAFQAANAGMECARRVRRDLGDRMLSNQSIDPQCFGVAYNERNRTRYQYEPLSETHPGVTGDGDVLRYRYSFTW